jgi:hypothetical protein
MAWHLSFAPLVFAGALFATGAAADEPVDLELVLAVDVSRSIDEAEAALQREGYVRAFRDPDVIHAVQRGILGRIAVTYVEWAGAGIWRRIANWHQIDGAESAEAFIAKLNEQPPLAARRTSISGAIDMALRQFAGNGFEGTRRAIDISGDGPNNDGVLVTTARDLAVAADVTINGLAILDGGSGMYSWYNIPDLDLYYENCVIGGPGAFVTVAEGFPDFARAVRRKLILEIAGRPPPEAPRLIRAQARTESRIPPPCDIGEQLRSSQED